jgi:NAD(P)-dependent dehydrogenase (short-subunit alcohol dehydrogenase family)
MPIALITGAAGGIGSATAEEFARAGYWLVLMDRREIKEPQLAEHLKFSLDLTDENSVRNAIAEATQRFGRIDALVNIAGTNHQSGIREMQASEWSKLMEINVGAMFLTAKHALTSLLKSSGPSIVNMASISGHVASVDYPAYVTSKAAVESLTWAMSAEMFNLGIRVNAIAPGWVDAGFTKAALDSSENSESLYEAARRAHVLGRMASPNEIAKAILWLSSPKASRVNGETLFVDGGLMRVH